MNTLQQPVILFVVVLVTLGLLAYNWSRYKRQRPYSTELRKISLAETWISFIELKNSSSEQIGEREKLLDAISQRDLLAIRDDLVSIDKQKFSSNYPLTQIRLEIMASVDRRALNEELLNLPFEILQQLRLSNPELLQDNTEAERYLAANELRLMVLREYASLRFGDRAENDWLEVYFRAAKIKQRTLHGMIESSMQEQVTERTVRLQAVQLVDEKLREKLLRVPPGTTFEGLAD